MEVWSSSKQIWRRILEFMRDWTKAQKIKKKEELEQVMDKLAILIKEPVQLGWRNHT